MFFRTSFSSSSPSEDGSGSTVSPDAGIPGPFYRFRAHTIPIAPRRQSSAALSDFECDNRILSSFNPTQAYHIPTHGGLLLFPRSKVLNILDLSPDLSLRKTAGDASTDCDAFQREAAELVRKHRGSLKTCMTLEKGRRRGGRMMGLRGEGTVCRWKVPWAVQKQCIVTLSSKGCKDERVVLSTSDFDARCQAFLVNGASYSWRFVNPHELVLEKSIESAGPGKYVVGIFYLQDGLQTESESTTIKGWAGGAIKRAANSSGGTLVFDARGVDRYLCVATALIALKRERQRKAVLFSTI